MLSVTPVTVSPSTGATPKAPQLSTSAPVATDESPKIVQPGTGVVAGATSVLQPR
jgi:hypothetical protein